VRQERILAVLQERERTIAWLARKLGMPKATLWRKLHGQRPLSRQELVRISQILDIPVTLLETDLHEVEEPVHA
jgi:transcriptional regulator with XRE-family HTH domain